MHAAQTYLLRAPSAGRKLLSVAPERPNPRCFVCQQVRVVSYVLRTCAYDH
jgi:hypothetical protein